MVLEHTTQDARDKANAYLNSLTIADRVDRPGWFDRYPVARELPLETPLLDMLAYDDAAAFAEKPRSG